MSGSVAHGDAAADPCITRSRTQSHPRIVALDGLRGVSVLLVLMFHVGFIAGIDRGRYVPTLPIGATGATPGPPGLFESIVARGYLGVFVFFVLSGFLIAGPFIRWRICGEDRVAVGRYYARRFMRIEPPYAVAMIVSFGLARYPRPVVRLEPGRVAPPCPPSGVRIRQRVERAGSGSLSRLRCSGIWPCR